MSLLPLYTAERYNSPPRKRYNRIPQASVFATPSALAGLTFLISLSILLSSPYGITQLWLYKITTDSLGSALPKLTPQSAASVGLPDTYMVGLWTYCANRAGTVDCPNRSLFPPLFFFDLPNALLHDLVSSSTTNGDIENNIYLPRSVYAVASPRHYISMSFPQLLSYMSSLCYIVAAISSGSVSLGLWRKRINASVNRSMTIAASSFVLGFLTVTTLVCLITYRLNTEITLGYRVASCNGVAIFSLWSAAAIALFCKSIILASTREASQPEEERRINAKFGAAEANKREVSRAPIVTTSSSTTLAAAGLQQTITRPPSRSTTPTWLKYGGYISPPWEQRGNGSESPLPASNAGSGLLIFNKSADSV